jgi:integrase
MTEEEQKALDALQNLIEDEAKETVVYKKAENIIKEYPVLATTVSSIINQELGGSIDIGENKSIGFSINPKDKKASIGFNMTFQDGGFINKYASEGTVIGNELTFQQAFKNRIEVMKQTLSTGGAMSQGEIDKANRTYARLFGTTHKNKTYKSVLQDVFPDRKLNEILFSEVNTNQIQGDIYKKAQNQVWYKGKYGAAMDFQKHISGAIGNVVGSGKTATTFNAAVAYKDHPDILQGGKPGRGPILNEDVYQNTVKQINSIKDPSARRLAKIMLMQGIRETDLIRLTTNDIDFVNNTITTKSKKGAGFQKIRISDSVKTLFQQQVNSNPKGATIFSKPNVKFTNLASHYGKKINPALNKISLFDTVKDIDRAMTLEDLRRAMSMRATALGIPVDIVDKIQ